MSEAMLEHVNLTVRDAMGTADRLCALFGWTIRWQGASINDGYSVHVGGEASYLALYSPPSTPSTDGPESYYQMGGLNHIGITVDDLDAAEARISAAEYKTYSHGDYEPGRRSYLMMRTAWNTRSFPTPEQKKGRVLGSARGRNESVHQEPLFSDARYAAMSAR